MPFTIFLHSPLCSVSHRAPQIKIFKDGGYTFEASYLLSTPSSPTKLRVELIGEDNCWKHSMYLRFILDGEPRQVQVCKAPYKTTKYATIGLDEIRLSIWYPAIEKLANELGAKWYGKRPILLLLWLRDVSP